MSTYRLFCAHNGWEVREVVAPSPEAAVWSYTEPGEGDSDFRVEHVVRDVWHLYFTREGRLCVTPLRVEEVLSRLPEGTSSTAAVMPMLLEATP